MYKKILVPLDGSKLAEQILPYARLFAEAYNIPVELLKVNDPDTLPATAPPSPGREYLYQIAKQYLPLPLRVDQIVQLGNAADVIVDRARSEPACLIAMATHGWSGIQRWLLGGVANKVVHGASNPVLLIHPADSHDPASPVQLKTLFAPLDGSGLAEKIMPHVSIAAQKLRLEIQLVRAFTLPPDAYIVGNGVYLESLGQQKEIIRNEAETYLAAKTQELQAEGLEQTIWTAIEGDAAAEIIDLAHKTPNSLIAMSTHGRSGFGRWLLGSVTEKVIHHSRNPVLVIRPV
jgi:nucleotide-binding universal stress UspA family protein